MHLPKTWCTAFLLLDASISNEQEQCILGTQHAPLCLFEAWRKRAMHLTLGNRKGSRSVPPPPRALEHQMGGEKQSRAMWLFEIAPLSSKVAAQTLCCVAGEGSCHCHDPASLSEIWKKIESRWLEWAADSWARVLSVCGPSNSAAPRGHFKLLHSKASHATTDRILLLRHSILAQVKVKVSL